MHICVAVLFFFLALINLLTTPSIYPVWTFGGAQPLYLAPLD